MNLLDKHWAKLKVYGVAAMLCMATMLVAMRGAEAAQATSGVTYRIDAARTITVDPNSLQFGIVSSAEVLAGITNEQLLTATVKASRNWKVQIKGSSPSWTAGSGGRQDKPVGDIQYKLGTGGTYASLTTTDTVLSSSSSPTTSTALSVYFKVYLKNTGTDILDAPAAYTYSNVVFTLSQF